MTPLVPVFMAATSGGLLGALGIDWQALIVNIIAFLIILGLLGKYIYPVLNRALDSKAAELESAASAERKAQAELEKAQKERHAILGAAQVKADQLVDAATTEASETISAARNRAGLEADRIVAEAREQLAKDVAAARTALRTETATLVAQATETVLGEKLDSQRDNELIARTLETR